MRENPGRRRFYLIEHAHQAVQDALMALLPSTVFLRQGGRMDAGRPVLGRLADCPGFI